MPELALIEAVVFLQSVDLFAHCKAEEILRIAAIAQERRFAAGEKLFAAGDPADELYCVVRGQVTLDPAGARRDVGPLQTVGVHEILSGRLRPAGAVSGDDTLALAISADDLFDLLANNIEIVKSLFRHLVQQRNGATPGT